MFLGIFEKKAARGSAQKKRHYCRFGLKEKGGNLKFLRGFIFGHFRPFLGYGILTIETVRVSVWRQRKKKNLEFL